MGVHSRLRADRLAYWFVLVTVATVVCWVYLDGLDWEEPRLALSELVAGTAHKPFVYRQLLPSLIRAAIYVYPLPPAVYASVFIYLSFLVFTLAMRRFAALFWDSQRIVDFVGVASPVMLSPLMLSSRHVYDFSALALFLLGLLFMAQAKWKWFFPVYLLGCLNKETIALLSVVFVVCFWRSAGNKLFWKLLAAQGLIFGLVRLAITWRFQNNAGDVVENHLALHLLAVKMAPLMILAYASFGVFVLALALRDWKRKPFFLRQTVAALFPILYALHLWGGAPFEIRVFYEIYPALSLMILPTIAKRLPFWSAQRSGATDPHSVALYPRG